MGEYIHALPNCPVGEIAKRQKKNRPYLARDLQINTAKIKAPMTLTAIHTESCELY
jgi:hypothetical protein